MPATTEVPTSTAETSAKTSKQSNQKSVKRPRGRPLQHGTRTLETGADGVQREVITKAPPIPMPPNPVMGYNTKFPDLAFFEYWQKTDAAFPQRLTGYLYRLWPMIDRERSQLEKPREDRIKNIDKLYKPPLNDMELYHRYGAGDYDIRLNDAGSGGATVCRCFLRGFRDMHTYPPQIILEELVTEDPINRPYIQFARSSGIFKDENEGDQDMANVAAVEKLTDALQEQTQQITEMSEKRAETAEAELKALRDKRQEPATPSLEQVASTKGMEIMGEAMKTTFQQITAMQNPGAPMQMFKEVMAAAKELVQPSTVPSPAVAAPVGFDTARLLEMFMEREGKLQASVLALTEARFKDLETRLQPGSGQPNPSDPLAQTRNMLSFFKELDEFRGGGEGAVAKPTMWDNLPKIFTGLAALGSVIVTGMHNAAVMKTGQGTPVQPQLAPPEEGGQPALQIPGQSQPNPSNPMAQYHRFLEGIRMPMLGMMNDEGRETPGADFADWLMEAQGGGPQGRQFYEGLKAQGPDSIKALFQSYPPLWNQLAQIEAKFDAFLAEFLNHDEIRQAELAAEENPPEPIKPVRRVRVMQAPEGPAA